MNYIVFINEKGSEKLAIVTNIKTYYDINNDLCNIINKICDDNNYRFLIKRNIKSKTPKIEEKLFYNKH